jgi:hypothetical protein
MLLDQTIADSYYDRTAKLVANCVVTYAYDQPWLANRSRYPVDGRMVVSIDQRIPRTLKCGIDTSKSLPWHELSEWLAMNAGLPYDHSSPGGRGHVTAHNDVATPLERQEVERQKPDDPTIWARYTHEMDGLIIDVDDERIEHTMPGQDLRQFEEDDRKLLRETMAAETKDALVVDASSHDPTGTGALRKRFGKDMMRRWRRLMALTREAIAEKDIFGLGGVTPESIAHGDPVAAFSRWFEHAASQIVQGGSGGWMAPYMAQATEMGATRARSGPGAANRTQHFLSLASSELKGVISAAGQQAVRVMADGRAQRQRPAQIARAVAMRLKAIGAVRSQAIVAYMVVKAFNGAILDGLRAQGRTRVGIQAEHIHRPKLTDAARNVPQKRHGKTGKFVAFAKKPSQYKIRKAQEAERRLQALREVDVETADDADVCIVCEEIADNGPYDINTAEGLIPQHPGCRCCFIPAGEPRDDED